VNRGPTLLERVPRDAVFAALLFGLALLPRLYVALALAGEPVWDGHYYDYGARRIADGFGYSDDLSIDGRAVWHPWAHYPVGYSAFLALFYKLFGKGPHVAPIVNASVGAALAVVTFLLAACALSKARARIAGLLVALHPGLILYGGLVMTEPLAALLTLLAFWVAVVDRRPMRGIALGALVLGLAALVRPQALLCAPFLALRLFDEPKAPRRRGWQVATAVALACALPLVPILPWTARNCRVMDGCALVSTNGGWNLAIGAFPRATGRFETLRASDGCRVVTGQVQQDRCWFEYGLAQIRARPLAWLALIPKKLSFTFDHESFAVEYLREARPEHWPEDARRFARDVTTTTHRFLVVAAAFGGIAYRRRGAGARLQAALLVSVLVLLWLSFSGGEGRVWPFAIVASVLPFLPLRGRPPFPAALRLAAVLLASTVFTHAVFFGEDRYHVVVTPVLCLFVAAALRPSAAASTGASSMLHASANPERRAAA
jgi:4-amino-4-deoxy-L-arabinose transferase-like glycosyltransferase